MLDLRLYMLQRLSAMVMAPLVLLLAAGCSSPGFLPEEAQIPEGFEEVISIVALQVVLR